MRGREHLPPGDPFWVGLGLIWGLVLAGVLVTVGVAVAVRAL